jgi:hypothetical protein
MANTESKQSVKFYIDCRPSIPIYPIRHFFLLKSDDIDENVNHLLCFTVVYFNLLIKFL